MRKVKSNVLIKKCCGKMSEETCGNCYHSHKDDSAYDYYYCDVYGNTVQGSWSASSCGYYE